MGAVSTRPAPASVYLDVGIAAATLQGETASGDLHLVCATPDGAMVAAVDGLGHGAEAAEAAERAIQVLRDGAGQSLITLVRRCHDALKQTRGVAMSLAGFNASDDTMTWIAVGNVDGVLIRGQARSVPAFETIVMRGGVVGSRLPPLQGSVIALHKGDVLVFATDGIKTGFHEKLSARMAPQQVADGILTRLGKGTDDALVVVARYLGKPAVIA